ncbi:hypothetical protein AX17_001778 [Amanita inopinata Kibby_2008]|nr:hypothetical protein AX17_001778 [Amanita inopinata Kibby_2008]
MLPQTLLCLLNTAIVFAQATRQQLQLNTPTSFAQSDPPSALIIPNGRNLTVTVAICSGDNGAQRFFLTNSSSTPPDNPGPGGNQDTYEITLNQGIGMFNGPFPNGGVLTVNRNGPFEVGVSDSTPIHEVQAALPLLGDTTSNQAILFSAPFVAANNGPEPKYPNYTLPQAKLSIPPFPQAQVSNLSLVIALTSPKDGSRKLVDLPQTGCALAAPQSSSVGIVSDQTVWLRDTSGWRNQWIVDSLTPSTNYTVYVVQDKVKVSGPIYFVTKSASFPCTLVHSLPYCPTVAYSVPIPASSLPDGNTTFDSNNLPSSISEPLLSSLSNFTTNLLTFPCGRDMYSPIVTCQDCQAAYRRWLCEISFVRCGESSPQRPDSFTTMPVEATATGRGVLQPTGTNQQVLSALVPVPSPISTKSPNSRNPHLPAMDASYSMLLPCLEICTAVDRACPVFLQFRCPVPRFNAGASYGVSYIDSFDGDQGEGVTGAAQDRWGNVWCNGG